MRAIKYGRKRTGENWKKNRDVVSVKIGNTKKKWDRRTLEMVERKATNDDMDIQFTRVGKKRQIFNGKEK